MQSIASGTLSGMIFNLLERLFHKPKRKCIPRCNFTFWNAYSERKKGSAQSNIGSAGNNSL